MEADNSCEILLENDGYYMQILDDSFINLMVTNVRFFLEKDMLLCFGSPSNPEQILRIASINFPKLRVNFNGYRLTTKEKNKNWSTFYFVNNEESKELVLKEYNGEEEDEKDKMTLRDLRAKYLIGTADEAVIKLKDDLYEGFMRYIEDTGWVVKGRYKSDEDRFYGVSIRVQNSHKTRKQGGYKFKLYEGMRFVLKGFLFEICKIS